MKIENNYHDVIRKRLAKYRKECLKCLRSGYAWDDTVATVKLMNKILKNITPDAWPDPKNKNLYYKGYKIASGPWRVKLMYTDDTDSMRHADLKYKHDDHTAWVKENKKQRGTYINFDIGGS